MAKFLNTSAITYHLEELMKGARERIVIISPYLRFNDRIRELLEDKDRLKIDVRIVYGKNDLHPDESNWLRSLAFVRCSFCRNLHAKCYLNESVAIVTSMNMYEFSQVNNNEMGVLISRGEDGPLYDDTFAEAQRLIRVSDEVKISVEKVSTPVDMKGAEASSKDGDTDVASDGPAGKMVSTTQLAKLRGISGKEAFAQLLAKGLIHKDGESWVLTDMGQAAGGRMKQSKRFGDYITWPSALIIE